MIRHRYPATIYEDGHLRVGLPVRSVYLEPPLGDGVIKECELVRTEPAPVHRYRVGFANGLHWLAEQFVAPRSTE